jgi:clan AA aspartic protease
MIDGFVTATLQAVIPLDVSNDAGESVSTEAVIDTGFNGMLTLPPEIIERLQLIAFDKASRMLANGSITEATLYIARVNWQGRTVIVAAEEAIGSPLVGMELLLNNVVTLDVRNGGHVTIAETE